MAGSGGLRLLRTNPAFRALSIARVVSYIGDAVSLVALMLYVASTAGHALAVAMLLLIGDFAPALLSPLTGVVSDRVNRKHVMIACELAQGALLVVIALTLPPLWLLLALVGLRATIGHTFQPAARAAIPALVADEDLEAANSTVGFGANGGEAIGPFIAAGLFPLVGIRGVLLVDALSFVASAVLLTAVRSLPHAVPDGTARRSVLTDMKAGLGYIWSVPAVRVITLTFSIVVVFVAIDDVALVYLVRDTLHASASAVGLVLGGVGVGLLAGYLLLARYSGRAAMTAVLLGGLAVTNIGNVLTGLAWAVGVALALQTVRGLGIAAIDVASNTLFQRLVPAGMQGRAFGNLYGLIGVAAGISYVGGGFLLDATNAPVTLVVAGTCGTLVTAVAAVALPRAMRRTHNAPEWTTGMHSAE
jgi:MFS family permease